MIIRRRLIFYLGIAGTVIFLVFMFYSVCVDIPFAHHDSLRYFYKYFLPQGDIVVRDPYYVDVWSIGRPVAAEMEAHAFVHMKGLVDLSHARLFCVMLAGITAFLLTLCFWRSSFGVLLSVFLGVFMTAMPGFQYSIYLYRPWYILGIASMALAYLAWTSRLSVKWKILLAFTFLFFSLLCYATTAFVFLSFIAVKFLWSDPSQWNKTRQNVLSGAALLVFSSGLYFIFTKMVLSQWFPGRTLAKIDGDYQLALSVSQLLPKIWYLFHEGASFLFNPFSPNGGMLAGHAIILFILFVLIKDKTWTGWERWGRLLSWCGLFLFSVLVWIISPMDLFLYRVLYPGMVFCMVSLVWAVAMVMRLQGVSKTVIRSCLVVMLGVGILGAQKALAQNVWNANAEMTFIRSQLARIVKSEIRRIHIVEPVFTGYGFNGKRVMDDTYNMNSSNYQREIGELVRMGLWGQIADRPLFYCRDQQEECIKKSLKGTLLLTQSKPGEPVVVSENTIVVDFNDMVRASQVFRR